MKAGWTGYLIGIVAVSGLLLGHAPRLIDTTYYYPQPVKPAANKSPATVKEVVREPKRPSQSIQLNQYINLLIHQ